MHPVANLISLGKCAPGIILNLLHAEADAARFWIHTEDFHFNGIARSDDSSCDAAP